MTALGRLMVVIGLGSWGAGWLTGWTELMVVAAGSMAALLLASPFVVGRLRLDARRVLQPERVTVGDPAVAFLRVANPGRIPSRPSLLEDRVGPTGHPVAIPLLAPGQGHDGSYPLPTTRRGVIPIGPLVTVRQDPLRLLRREVEQAGTDTLFVHPRVLATRALPVGFARDLEGPTSDTSPAGDVAFHALREYQMGDDFRHIHWLSTARSGTTMVRHHVDNRRPTLAVLLDDREAVLDGDRFETAVEATASLAVSSLAAQQPVSVGFGLTTIRNSSLAGSRPSVLDQLAAVEPRPGADPLEAAGEALRRDPGASALVLVTGAVHPRDIVRLAGQLRRRVRIIVVRVWPDRSTVEPTAVMGATVLDVCDLGQFQAAWNRFAS